MTSPEEHRRDRADERDARSAWAALAREAAALLAVDPDLMTVEERERLEALTDAFIAVVAYEERVTPSSAAYGDPRLVAQLAQQARIDRRSGAHGGERDDPGPRARASLREDILAGLHSERLGVRIGIEPPPRHPLARAQAIGQDLLAEAEHEHRAVVVPELSIAAGAGRELWAGECDTLVEVPRALPRGRYLALRVSGESMEPLLRSGDVVLIRLGAAAQPGTVIVARDPEHGYVVKEVGCIDGEGIELLSLNAAFAPRRLSAAPGAVLGTVLMRWRVHDAAVE